MEQTDQLLEQDFDPSLQEQLQEQNPQQAHFADYHQKQIVLYAKYFILLYLIIRISLASLVYQIKILQLPLSFIQFELYSLLLLQMVLYHFLGYYFLQQRTAEPVGFIKYLISKWVWLNFCWDCAYIAAGLYYSTLYMLCLTASRGLITFYILNRIDKRTHELYAFLMGSTALFCLKGHIQSQDTKITLLIHFIFKNFILTRAIDYSLTVSSKTPNIQNFARQTSYRTSLFYASIGKEVVKLVFISFGEHIYLLLGLQMLVIWYALQAIWFLNKFKHHIIRMACQYYSMTIFFIRNHIALSNVTLLLVFHTYHQLIKHTNNHQSFRNDYQSYNNSYKPSVCLLCCQNRSQMWFYSCGHIPVCLCCLKKQYRNNKKYQKCIVCGCYSGISLRIIWENNEEKFKTNYKGRIIYGLLDKHEFAVQFIDLAQ